MRVYPLMNSQKYTSDLNEILYNYNVNITIHEWVCGYEKVNLAAFCLFFYYFLKVKPEHLHN